MTMKAALFYALAINEAVTVLPADKSYARPLRAGQILEQVLAAQPDASWCSPLSDSQL